MRTPANKVLRGYGGRELTDAFTRYLGDAEPGNILSSPAVAGSLRNWLFVILW